MSPKPSAAQRFETQTEFAQHLIELLETASKASHAPSMTWCDPDFVSWPLDDARVLDALGRWALPHRRLIVLAREFDTLARQHPRWVHWRRLYAHVVECRAAAEPDAADLPSVLLIPGIGSIRRIHPQASRGLVSTDLGDETVAAGTIDAALQRSTPSFPAVTLGL